ncbi:MAG: transglycosylase SLT domain-containing protein [bacterium]
MDVTTAAVVLLFVVSIFSGFGNTNISVTNKSNTLPPETRTIHQEVSVTAPDPSYVDDPAAQAAINKYICQYRPAEEAATISNSIVRYSKDYNVNPKLVAALMRRESRFNPRAVSSSGAMGLGQLLPSTCKGLKIDDGFDIDQNAKGTVRYMKSLLDRFKGKVASAIAGYLEGPNAVSRQGGFSNHTKGYVEDILKIYQKI